MNILAHRGLDLERTDKLAENSLASFVWSFQRGLGVELDLQVTSEGELIVAHDGHTERWTGGRMRRDWSDISSQELHALEHQYSPLCRFQQALQVLAATPKVMLAIHLKSPLQRVDVEQSIISALREFPDLHSRLLIFDLSSASARRLRSELPRVALAASVADDADREMYGGLTGGTLMRLPDVLQMSGVFDWVWLDEWSSQDHSGQTKQLYTAAVIQQCRAHNVRVAVISPELHRQENHADAGSIALLEGRWRRLWQLGVDAICTDYPARFSALRSSALAPSGT